MKLSLIDCECYVRHTTIDQTWRSARMWALNKGDWPWLLLGFIGAVIAGGCAPSEGVFIAQVQVRKGRFLQ